MSHNAQNKVLGLITKILGLANISTCSNHEYQFRFKIHDRERNWNGKWRTRTIGPITIDNKKFVLTISLNTRDIFSIHFSVTSIYGSRIGNFAYFCNYLLDMAGMNHSDVYNQVIRDFSVDYFQERGGADLWANEALLLLDLITHRDLKIYLKV